MSGSFATQMSSYLTQANVRYAVDAEGGFHGSWNPPGPDADFIATGSCGRFRVVGRSQTVFPNQIRHQLTDFADRWNRREFWPKVYIEPTAYLRPATNRSAGFRVVTEFVVPITNSIPDVLFKRWVSVGLRSTETLFRMLRREFPAPNADCVEQWLREFER